MNTVKLIDTSFQLSLLVYYSKCLSWGIINGDEMVAKRKVATSLCRLISNSHWNKSFTLTIYCRSVFYVSTHIFLLFYYSFYFKKCWLWLLSRFYLLIDSLFKHFRWMFLLVAKETIFNAFQQNRHQIRWFCLLASLHSSTQGHSVCQHVLNLRCLTHNTPIVWVIVIS